MRRVTTLSLLFLLIASAAGAFEWQTVAQRVQRSLVSLQDRNGNIYCTGFVIDDSKDFVMTAQHCTAHNEGIIVDRVNAWVIWSDVDADIAVLHVPGVQRVELRPGKQPAPGQEIAAFGFGYGLKGSGMFRSGEVSGLEVVLEGLPGKWLITNFALIPGMSGGPMVDSDGRVLSINQRGNDVIGLGRSIDDIIALTRSFWRY